MQDLSQYREVSRVYRSHESAASSYDTLAHCYDCWSDWEAPYVARGLELLALQPGESCVEIGCGTGKALSQIADSVGPGGHVVGHDISANMVSGPWTETDSHNCFGILCCLRIHQRMCTALPAGNSNTTIL